jgi:hypothetical protein
VLDIIGHVAPREPRPRADWATLISAVVSVLGLGMSFVAWHSPREPGGGSTPTAQPSESTPSLVYLVFHPQLDAAKWRVFLVIVLALLWLAYSNGMFLESGRFLVYLVAAPIGAVLLVLILIDQPAASLLAVSRLYFIVSAVWGTFSFCLIKVFAWRDHRAKRRG